jgi:hypothetical protein
MPIVVLVVDLCFDFPYAKQSGPCGQGFKKPSLGNLV